MTDETTQTQVKNNEEERHDMAGKYAGLMMSFCCLPNMPMLSFYCMPNMTM